MASANIDPSARNVATLRRHARLGGAALAIAAIFAAAPAALAQSRDALPVDVADCVGLTAAIERLDCFDRHVVAAQRERAANPATRAQSTSDAPAQAAAPARAADQTARVAPTPPPPADADRSQEFRGTITELREVTPGLFVITLDNGQVWREQSADSRPLRVGQHARVSTTGSGTLYRLTVDEAKGFIRVLRVR